MTTQTVGIVTVVWKGTTYSVVKGANFRLPGMQNTAQPAGMEFNYSQQFQQGQLRATIQIKKGMSLAQFLPGATAELQVQADTGQIWTMPAALIMSAPEMSDDGGKAPITWNFGTYSELVS